MTTPSFDSWYAGRTVVVTGAYGYLGTGLSMRLQAAGARLRRATRGSAAATQDPLAWVGELDDPAFVRSLVRGADAIFHLAGQTSVKSSHDEPLADLKANVTSTLTLLDACSAEARGAAFVHAGTATQVGLTTSTLVGADTPDLPVTVYDANKLAAEHLVRVFSDRGLVHGLTLRIANVYGPGAAKSAPDRGVTNRLLARAMEGQPLTYYGDGELLRDHVYIDDLLTAFFRAPAVAARARAERYVVASGTGHTLRQSFELIAEVVASLGFPRVDVLSVPWPPGSHPIDQRSFVADTAPLADLMGWRATTSLREGLLLTATSLLPVHT